jgi:hypothetical protein
MSRTHPYSPQHTRDAALSPVDDMLWRLFTLPISILSTLPWERTTHSLPLPYQVEIGGNRCHSKSPLDDFVEKVASSLPHTSVVCAFNSLMLTATMLLLSIYHYFPSKRCHSQLKKPKTADKYLSLHTRSSNHTVLQRPPQDLTLLLNWPHHSLSPPPPPEFIPQIPSTTNTHSVYCSPPNFPSAIHSAQYDLLSNILTNCNNRVLITTHR